MRFARNTVNALLFLLVLIHGGFQVPFNSLPIANASEQNGETLPLTIKKKVPKPMALPQAPPAAAPAPLAEPYTGKVLQSINSGGYSYVELRQASGEKIWFAVPATEIPIGTQQTFNPGMLMNNFESKALKRTFDKIIFTEVAGSPARAAAPPAEAPAAEAPAAAHDSSVNARLLNFNVGYNEFILLIPSNYGDYKYLRDVKTAVLFIHRFNVNAINNLKVTQLLSGSLESGDYYNILKLNRIIGFEKYAEELKTMDEFSATAKKGEMLTKLKECYNNYKNEYDIFLKGKDGFYTFKNASFANGKTLASVSRKNYNFDNSVFSVKMFTPDSTDWSGLGKSGWEERYIRSLKYRQEQSNNMLINQYNQQMQLNQKSKKKAKNIPYPTLINPISEYLNAKMPIDKAKVIFEKEDEAFVDTLVTVKPRFGIIEDGVVVTTNITNFDIHKITKRFYNKNNENEPVLNIDIISTKSNPLY